MPLTCLSFPKELYKNLNMSLSPSLMEESLLFVGKLKKYIYTVHYFHSCEYKMFTDCSLLWSNFLYSAINSTGP